MPFLAVLMTLDDFEANFPYETLQKLYNKIKILQLEAQLVPNTWRTQKNRKSITIEAFSDRKLTSK